MKRKSLLLFLLVLFSLITFQVYAEGGSAIGGAFSIDILNGPYNGGVFLFKFDKVPFMFGLGGRIKAGGDISVGFTSDWWFYRSHLTGIFNLYVGSGLFLTIKDRGLDLGAHIPVGLQIFLLDPLEIFVQLSPGLGIRFEKGVEFPLWSIQGAAGFRVWF